MKESFLSIAHSLKPLQWLSLVGGILFLSIWIFGNPGIYELHKLYTIKQELIQKKVGLLKSKKKLRAELLLLEKPAYLEKLVRQELGYTHPSEIVIHFHGLE